ncbi:uncharacterized protein F13E9.13, mitochondrial [Venturia canescens]|uniref:uncharacterized protein F13E9.13, mitochondrial n=1 Tax=Venturia canescens TaxID=32260 RepID=UPI001C9D34B7|nr:uncharacterized protein F13E9.13, mitochondrial [Venturia canescens]
MQRFRTLFPKPRCSIVGMIHVGGLPGTPRFNGNCKKLIDAAVRDAEIYRDAGLDGILVENMHDVPYVRGKDLGPETTAMMSRICSEVRKNVPASVVCGVQVLAGGNTQAIAIAQAADFQFIRAEGFVFGHVADEGFTDACAGELLRYRRKIGADDVLVFADIKKKHSSHAITADVSLSETAKAAEFFLADGVILTGIATGKPADEVELDALLNNVQGPVIIGSGVDKENLVKYVRAHAVIIGSHFKIDGKWENSVDPNVVNNFMSHLSLIH